MCRGLWLDPVGAGDLGECLYPCQSHTIVKSRDRWRGWPTLCLSACQSTLCSPTIGTTTESLGKTTVFFCPSLSLPLFLQPFKKDLRNRQQQMWHCDSRLSTQAWNSTFWFEALQQGRQSKDQDLSRQNGRNNTLYGIIRTLHLNRNYTLRAVSSDHINAHCEGTLGPSKVQWTNIPREDQHSIAI